MSLIVSTQNISHWPLGTHRSTLLAAMATRLVSVFDVLFA